MLVSYSLWNLIDGVLMFIWLICSTDAENNKHILRAYLKEGIEFLDKHRNRWKLGETV